MPVHIYARTPAYIPGRSVIVHPILQSLPRPPFLRTPSHTARTRRGSSVTIVCSLDKDLYLHPSLVSIQALSRGSDRRVMALLMSFEQDRVALRSAPAARISPRALLTKARAKCPFFGDVFAGRPVAPDRRRYRQPVTVIHFQAFPV